MTTYNRQFGSTGSDPTIDMTSNNWYPLRRLEQLGLPILHSELVPDVAKAALDKCVKSHVGNFTLGTVTTQLEVGRGCTSRFRESQQPNTLCMLMC